MHRKSSSSYLSRPVKITKEIAIISNDEHVLTNPPSPALSPQEQDDYQSYSLFSKKHDKPSLERLNIPCKSLQRNWRQAHVNEKELPPAPQANATSPKNMTEPFPDLQPITAESKLPSQQDQTMCLSQNLEGLGYDKPSRGYFDTQTSTARRTRAPIGVESVLHKVQPTYTVTISAPRPVRRFSKLSSRSKESYPADPLDPITIIAQKSNGVEPSGIAYLPRYTNKFAGFCKSRPVHSNSSIRFH